MVKKRKAPRPAAARGAKKKVVKKKIVKKKAAAPRKMQAPPQYFTGLEATHEVRFQPLKDLIGAHITRLYAVKDPSEKVQRALKSLQTVQRELTEDCDPTMAIPTP